MGLLPAILGGYVLSRTYWSAGERLLLHSWREYRLVTLLIFLWIAVGSAERLPATTGDSRRVWSVPTVFPRSVLAGQLARIGRPAHVDPDEEGEMAVDVAGDHWSAGG